MSQAKDEISITVTCVDNQRTDTFMVSQSLTTLSDLCYMSMAVLLTSSSSSSSSLENQDEEYCLLKHPNNTTAWIIHSSKDSSSSSATLPLSQAGIVDGDWILLQSRKSLNRMESIVADTTSGRQYPANTTDTAYSTSSSSHTTTPAAAAAAAAASSSRTMGGFLDFSSLLNNSNTTAASSVPPMNNTTISSGGLDFSALLNNRSASNTSSLSQTWNNNNKQKKNNSSGLVFHLPLVPTMTTTTTTTHSSTSTSPQSNYIHWDGMTLDQAIQYNSNPESFIRVLFHNLDNNDKKIDSSSSRTYNYEETTLFREFHHYHPTCAKKIKQLIVNKDKNISPLWKEASQVWLQKIQTLSMAQGLHQSLSYTTHENMIQRLQDNPMDEQANIYFGKKLHQETIQHQYEQMMEEYPESFVSVVMLYIHVVVDGKYSIQALVDSGAQMTIMSKACAERCHLLHLVDTRFAGIAVGVGQGKILGRIHIVPLKIGNTFFPCSITVMDGGGGKDKATSSSSIAGGEENGDNTGGGSGFGDKNVDLLFGLDMLKRHRCKIDLETNCLLFTLENDMKTLSTPFLHERELEVRRGGTKDLDVSKMNAEMEGGDDDDDTKM